MAATGQQFSSERNFNLPPDGRQTRIDFFNSDIRSRDEKHIVQPRRNSKEWWQSLTSWLKSTRQEKDHQREAFEKYLTSKKFSTKTIHSYMFMMEKFFNYLDNKSVRKVTLGSIEDYNYEFFVRGRYSRSYQLQFINALTHYMEFSENIQVNLRGLRKSKLPAKRQVIQSGKL